jgi:ribosomal protein L39E
MARYKPKSKKLKLGKQGRRTRWAPFWLVMKVYGKGKKIHPARLTSIKRSWRRTKLKIKPRRIKQRSHFK